MMGLLADLIHYEFMRWALLAIVLVTPMYALLGTAVINQKMTFFTDVLGHSTLTGLAIGIMLGLKTPLYAMVCFSIVLALAVHFFKGTTASPSDTVLGVLLSFVMALGVVVLSARGGFAKYTSFLIGDILAINSTQLQWLGVLLVSVAVFWIVMHNPLLLSSVSSSIARSRGKNVGLVEIMFSVLVAVVVTLSIQLVGLLIINSLLILPAAASRNVAKSVQGYTAFAVIFSMASGIIGFVLSYFLGTATGATIVLVAVAIYGITAFIRTQ